MLTFPALTLHSDKRTTLKTSAVESLFGGQITSINSVDKPNINFLVRYANLHRTKKIAAVRFTTGFLVRFFERFKDLFFHFFALRIKGKCTSRFFFRYSGVSVWDGLLLHSPPPPRGRGREIRDPGNEVAACAFI